MHIICFSFVSCAGPFSSVLRQTRVINWSLHRPPREGIRYDLLFDRLTESSITRNGKASLRSYATTKLNMSFFTNPLRFLQFVKSVVVAGKKPSFALPASKVHSFYKNTITLTSLDILKIFSFLSLNIFVNHSYLFKFDMVSGQHG